VRRLAAYVVAVSSALLALAVGLTFPGIRDLPLLMFVSAVVISSSYGGLGPSLVATIVGFVALDLFFEDPVGGLVVTDISTSLDLVAFVIVSVALGSLNARLRRARRRAMDAQNEAEAALHARDEALAIVSHDLRTPLTAIKTSVSTLRRPGAPLTSATYGELLGTIEAQSDRLVHFVSDALAMTRLQAGITPDPQWNALSDIASAVLDRCSPVLGERPITFDVPDTLPLARFDAGLLDQALRNLLENVAAHTPAGSAVAIVGRVQDSAIRLEVSDAGPGIPREERERIFGKFERLGDDGSGTGLGLAIARAATHAQGGQLRVEDSPLGGARFVLQLPNEPHP
jgi:two-component system sensor histidine kinase KdpD